VPAAVKVSLYYRTTVEVPLSSSVRATAHILDVSIADGDAILTEPMRSVTILYYLSRAGYQLRDGWCVDSNKSKRFSCHLGNPAIEASLGSSGLSGRTEYPNWREEILLGLRRPGFSAWTVVTPGPGLEDEIFYWPASWMRIPVQHGFRPVRHGPGILQYRIP
jgi:hypothetical protein